MEEFKENVDNAYCQNEMSSESISQHPSLSKPYIKNATPKGTSVQKIDSRCTSITPRKPILTALALIEKDGIHQLVEKRVFHSGVPVKCNGPVKRTTTIQPFSFEERDKAAQRRKQEKLQKILDEKKEYSSFHANPLPAYLKHNRV